MNFDGASFGNPGMAGYGCVIRDSQGAIILVKGGPIGISDANHAKTIGLLEALRMHKSGDHQDCYVEGDSMTVLGWGRGQTQGSWRLSFHLRDQRSL